MDPKSIKQLIVGATATTSAILISEIAKQHHKNQRANSSSLAQQVRRFATKDSIGDALRKASNLPPQKPSEGASHHP